VEPRSHAGPASDAAQESDAAPRGGAETGSGFDPLGPRRRIRHPFLWAFLVGIAVLTLMRPLLRHVPAPPPVEGRLPALRLVDQEGRPFGPEAMHGDVWIVGFVGRPRGADPAAAAASASPAAAGRTAGAASASAEASTEKARLDGLREIQDAYRDFGVRGIRILVVSLTDETTEAIATRAAAAGADPKRFTFARLDPSSPPRALEILDVARHAGELLIVDADGGLRGWYASGRDGLNEIYNRAQHVRGVP